MKPYNGFTPAERMEAFNWLRSTGKAAPAKCDLCGQTKGVLEWHSEDYGKPFGPLIGEFGLCYPCHMVIHCRFSARDAFWAYLGRLESGYKTLPYLTRNWARFKAGVLAGGDGEWDPIREPWDFNPVTFGRFMAYWRRFDTLPKKGAQ